MHKIVDLFAGCGGMSLGFQNAGFEIAGAFEYWEVAASCYEKNFKHPIYRTDLSNVDNSLSHIVKLEPNIIIGGPPCQDFSHAGKRIEAGRASLTESFAEIVCSIQPEYFVMENVDRAANSNAFTYAQELFVAAGYGLTKVTLDASHCGVPQKRKRFFCIGAMNQKNDFLLDDLNSELSINETTLRDYFGETLGFEYYYRHPRNYSRRGVFSIDEPAPTMRGVNRPVPKGYLGHPNDPCALNSELRALTTLERALIQTFPADFKWQGSKTDVEQMIGNAVPIKLAEFVATALKKYIQNSEKLTKKLAVFSSWILESGKYTKNSTRDVTSRIKRANMFLPISGVPDAYYIFQLEQIPEYQQLSTSVRSQIKRSICLYKEYCDNLLLMPARSN